MSRNRTFQPQRHVAIVVRAALVALILIGAAACDLNHNFHADRYPTPTLPPIPPVDPTSSAVTVTREVQGFNAVSLEGVGTVQIQNGSPELLTLTADETLVPYLTSEVVSGTLVLGMDLPSTNQQPDSILFEVGATNLDRVELVGVGGIDARHIDTSVFSASLTGVGNIRATGRVDRQEVVLTGVGAYRASNLSSRTAIVNMTGVNDAVIRVSERLEAFVASPCVLEFYGDPVLVIRGNGTVRRLGA